MTARAAAALARLREAGPALRARRARDVLDALGDVLDAWSAPGSPWQKALAEALPAVSGFSPAVVREGLARGLAPYTGDALRALIGSELGSPERLDAESGLRVAGFDTTAQALAGAIPLPAFVAIAAPLALRSPVLVKPSAHDPVTAGLLARSLAERDALLGACVEIADFRRDDAAELAAFGEADCVVATGSDAAVAAIGALARGRRFVAHGHLWSVALLGPGATHGEALAQVADGLARDTALWDQLGCLSPVAVHAADADPRAADRVAEAVAAALEAAERRWPRGHVEPAVAATIAHERAEAELRAAADGRGALLASEGTRWTVVREVDARARCAPLHRFLRVHPAADLDAAVAALAPDGPRLAGVALAGCGDRGPAVAAALASRGATRICVPGALQAPPLDWPRGGLPVLGSLARWSRLEVS